MRRRQMLLRSVDRTAVMFMQRQWKSLTGQSWVRQGAAACKSSCVIRNTDIKQLSWLVVLLTGAAAGQ